MCHVLIIEDEALIALHVQIVLEHEGASTFAFAETQTGAVEAAILQRPALITSDVRLREGAGPLAVQNIHDRLGFIPVIFITTTPDICTPCAPPGLVLTKPIDERALAAAFHELKAA